MRLINYLLLGIFTLSKISSLSMLVLIPLTMAERMDSVAYSQLKSFEYIPVVLLGVYIGHLLDLHRKLDVLRFTIIVQAIALFSLYACLQDYFPNILIYPSLFILSACSYTVWSSVNTISNRVIPKVEHHHFNSNLTIVQNTLDLLIPVCVAFLYTYLGYKIIIFLLFPPLVSFGISIYYSNLLDDGVRGNNNRKFSFISSYRNLRSNKPVFDLCIIIMTINAIELMPGTMLAFYAINSLGLSSLELSYIYTGGALGGLLAGVLVKKLSSSHTSLMQAVLYTSLLNSIIYLIIWITNNYYVLLFLIFFENIFIVVSAVSFRSLRQRLSSESEYGSILGASGAMVKCLVPIAIILSGYIMHAFAPIDVFLLAFALEITIVPVLIWCYFNKHLKKRTEPLGI